MEQAGVRGLFDAQPNQEVKAKRELWVEHAKRLIRSGQTTDDVLTWLRSQGGSQIDSVVVLNAAAGMKLKDAKHAVHSSTAWADMKEYQERFWDELESAIPPETERDQGKIPTVSENK